MAIALILSGYTYASWHSRICVQSTPTRYPRASMRALLDNYIIAMELQFVFNQLSLVIATVTTTPQEECSEQNTYALQAR
jgi:hypothetical protein